MADPSFVNLTPHDINIIDVDPLDGRSIRTSGLSARCAQTQVKAGEHNGVALSRITFGQIEVIDNETKQVVRVGLPDPMPGVIFVVSALVRAAVPGRSDVASPGDLVRNDAGQVVGCRGLVIN